MKVVFMRHGETILNKEKRFSGIIDCCLTNDGIEKAKNSKFKEGEFDFVYTSSLKRAIDTAKLVYPYKKAIINNYIIERKLGDFEGRIKKEVDSELVKLFRENKYIPNGAETTDEVAKRVLTFIEYLKQTHLDEDRILVISHAGIIRELKKIFLDNYEYFSDNLEILEINI